MTSNVHLGFLVLPSYCATNAFPNNLAPILSVTSRGNPYLAHGCRFNDDPPLVSSRFSPNIIEDDDVPSKSESFACSK
jgi:hypothetical protein